VSKLALRPLPPAATVSAQRTDETTAGICNASAEEMILQTNTTLAEPSEQSYFLGALLPQYPSELALDLGCGSGYLAITMAMTRVSKVIASDVSVTATNMCRDNVRRNGVGSIVFSVVSDLFSAFSNRNFDLIVCNPPSLPINDDSTATPHLGAGPDGRFIIDRIVSDFSTYLARNGRLLLAHTSLSDLPKTLRLLQARRIQHKIVASKRIVFRTEYYAHMSHLSILRRRGQAEFSRVDGRLVSTVSILELR
jgi:HemK-related putative methylase